MSLIPHKAQAYNARVLSPGQGHAQSNASTAASKHLHEGGVCTTCNHGRTDQRLGEGSSNAGTQGCCSRGSKSLWRP